MAYSARHQSWLGFEVLREQITLPPAAWSLLIRVGCVGGIREGMGCLEDMVATRVG